MNDTAKCGEWQRVSRRRPCPVCKKSDWCVYTGDDDAPEAALCQRVESAKRIGEAGWLHKLRESSTAWAPWRSTFRRAVRLATERSDGDVRPDFDKLAAEGVARCDKYPETLDRFGRGLGLTVGSLRRLGTGYLPQRRAWSFPMTDSAGDVTGIRLRLAGGKKLSVRGGHEGLFLPADLAPEGRLLICEGPTDTAALLDLGFQAVGRPSCTGGVTHVVALVKRMHPMHVVIAADGDTPGKQGAERLAAKLAAYVPDLRVITPPDGMKDARQWKQHGATPGDVQAAIDRADARRLRVTAKGR